MMTYRLFPLSQEPTLAPKCWFRDGWGEPAYKAHEESALHPTLLIGVNKMWLASQAAVSLSFQRSRLKVAANFTHIWPFSPCEVVMEFVPYIKWKIWVIAFASVGKIYILLSLLAVGKLCFLALLYRDQRRNRHLCQTSLHIKWAIFGEIMR